MAFHPGAEHTDANSECETVKRLFVMFLYDYMQDTEDRRLVSYYREEANKMMRMKKTTMTVDFNHLIDKAELVDAINNDYYK